MTSRRDKLIDVPEHRSLPASDFETRASGNSLILTGYASVFDNPYDVYGGPPDGWAETIDKGAFDRTLREKPDLHLLINHEGMPLARTKSGTLQLETDKKGLKVRAELDRRDPDVQRLEPKMVRGDMDEMSFAFRVKGQQWSDDQTERMITEVSLHKGDVSVVNFGANPATSASLRGLLGSLEEIDLAEARDIGADDLIRAHKFIEKALRAKGNIKVGTGGANVGVIAWGTNGQPGTTSRLAMLKALGDGTDLPD